MADIVGRVERGIGLFGGDVLVRFDEDVPVVSDVRQRSQHFADVHGDHGAALDAEGHVGADFDGDLAQLPFGEPGAGQRVETDKDGRGIGTSAGKTCREGDMLFDVDMDAGVFDAGGFEEAVGGFPADVGLIGGEQLVRAGKGNGPGLSGLGQSDGVVDSDRLHDHKEGMVPVFGLPQDI